MKQRGVFLAGAVFSVLYFFLFPRGAGREPVLLPESLTPMDSTSVTSSSVGPTRAVVAQGRAGYFDSNHSLTAFYAADRIAANDEWLALPGEDGVEIIEPDGRLRVRIPLSGTPLIRRDSLYLYHEEAGRLTQVAPQDGRVLWTQNFLSPLTVLDAAQERTFVGLLDGRAFVFGSSGDLLLEYRPGGSRIEAIYGGAFSDDGKSLALISGLDPQRFVLLEERKNGYRPVTHHDTGTDFRRGVPVGFVAGGGRILYEGNGSVTAVDRVDFIPRDLPIEGYPLGWVGGLLPDTLMLLDRQKDGDGMTLLSRDDLLLYTGKIPSGALGITGDGQSLYIDTSQGVATLEAMKQ